MWQFSDDVLGLRLSRFLSYDCVQDRPAYRYYVWIRDEALTPLTAGITGTQCQ